MAGREQPQLGGVSFQATHRKAELGLAQEQQSGSEEHRNGSYRCSREPVHGCGKPSDVGMAIWRRLTLGSARGSQVKRQREGRCGSLRTGFGVSDVCSHGLSDGREHPVPVVVAPAVCRAAADGGCRRHKVQLRRGRS